jgi:hypothetical protein
MNLLGIHQASASVSAAAQATLDHAYLLILSSVGLGLLLTVVNVLIARLMPKSALAPDPEARSSPAALLLSSSNIVFLCVGVTGVMLLVASDLARAFAVAAAIALVRFRIKMSESSGSSLFFALIVGMACGVDHVGIAGQLALIFIVLQFGLLFTVKRLAAWTGAEPPTAQMPRAQLASSRS